MLNVDDFIRQQRLHRVIITLTYEWQSFAELKAKTKWNGTVLNNGAMNMALGFLLMTNQIESIFGVKEIPSQDGRTTKCLRNKQKLYRLKVKSVSTQSNLL